MARIVVPRTAVAGAGAACLLSLAGCHSGHATTAARPQPSASSPTPTVTPTTTPSLTPTLEAISWAAIPYEAVAAPAVPGTIAHPDKTPWCTSAQLAADASGFQGATGSAAGSVRVRNTGSHPCALQGIPTVTGYGANDRVVATPRPQDSFQLHPWVVLAPHKVALAGVQIFGDGSRCVGPVRRLVVNIGNGQPPISVTATWVDGGKVQPRCGTAAPNQLRGTYDNDVSDWRNRNGGPRLPGADAGATIDQVPATVMQGAVLRYRVTLIGLPTSPCLPFRERLRREANQSVIADQVFVLDCPAITAQPYASQRDVALDMQLAVPPNAPPGNVELAWDLPVGVTATWDQSIRIVTAPPQCAQEQLHIALGRHGAAAGSFYTPVVFRNISARACSLRGYPGIEYVAPDGSPMPTHPRHGPEVPVETIAVAPGKAASAMLSGADFGPNGGAKPCPATGGLRVIAPGLSTQVLLRPGLDDCEGGKIFVSPVQNGTRPRPV